MNLTRGLEETHTNHGTSDALTLLFRFGAEVIGYRPVTTLQVTGSEAGSSPKGIPKGVELLPPWVDGNVTSVEVRRA